MRHVQHAAVALRNLIAATSETERLVSDMQASGQKVADAMAAAFQQHGPLEVNFATIVRVDSRGAYVLDD